MEKRIQWTCPDWAYPAYVAKAQPILQWFLLRLFLLTCVTGAAGIIVIYKIYPNLPTRIYTAMWKGVGLFAGLILLCSVACLVEVWVRKRWPTARPKYALSDSGATRGDNTRLWKRYCAFTIEPDPDVDGLNRLVLYSERGMHLRMPMPEGRKAELVIRFVARHLPLLEEMDDPDAIAQELNDPHPVMLWTIGLLNLTYAVAVGYLAKQWFRKDDLQLIWISTFFINPAMLILLAGSISGWFRRKRIEVTGWCFVFSLLTLFTFMIGVILAP